MLLEESGSLAEDYSTKLESSKQYGNGNSLVVQRLGLGAVTDRAWVQSLVGELRSCKLRGVAKTNNTKKKNKKKPVCYWHKNRNIA